MNTSSLPVRASGRVRYSTVLFLVTLLFASFSARDAQAQGLHLRGGVNLSNASLDPTPTAPVTTKMLRGYSGTFLAELGGGPVRLLVGAGYQQHGITTEGGAGAGDHRLEYATIPVMVGLGAPSVNANVSVFLNLGIEPSFLIASSLPAGSATLPDDELHDFDFAMRAELGAELPLSYSGPALVIAVGYGLGMVDAHRGDLEWRNSTFQGLVGIKFRTL